MITLFAVALASVAASSDTAALRSPVAPVAATTVRAPDEGAAAKASTPTRYCAETTPIGTRIRHRDCRTRAEWLERGFDPLATE